MKLPLILAATLALAQPTRAEVLQATTKVYPITTQRRVHIEFPVGSLHVEANDDTHVRLSLIVKCGHSSGDDCADWAKGVRLTAHDEGDVLSLKIDKLPKFPHNIHLEGTLQVPKALGVHVEMGVGEVKIYDMEGELDVDLGVGEVQAHLPDENVHAVDIAVGVGDASLHRQGQTIASRGFIGREVHWDDGGGRARVRFQIGVGDGEVRLE